MHISRLPFLLSKLPNPLRFCRQSTPLSVALLALAAVSIYFKSRSGKLLSPRVAFLTVTAISLLGVIRQCTASEAPPHRKVSIVGYRQDEARRPKTPDDIFRIEKLQPLFNLDAGVEQRYTVLVHSKRVIERAIEFRDIIEPILNGLNSNPFTFESFLLFLAIHDIGKGNAAKEAHRAADAARDQRKDAREINVIYRATLKRVEKAETAKLLAKFKSGEIDVGLTPQQLAIAEELLKEDPLFDLLTGEKSMDECVTTIRGLSKTIPAHEWLEIVDIFNWCDAGSYPNLKSQLYKADGYSRKEDAAAKVATLKQRLRSATRTP